MVFFQKLPKRALTNEDMTWKDHFLLDGRPGLAVFRQAVEFEARLVLSALEDGDVSLVLVNTDSVMSDERLFTVESE